MRGGGSESGVGLCLSMSETLPRSTQNKKRKKQGRRRERGGRGGGRRRRTSRRIISMKDVVYW